MKGYTNLHDVEFAVLEPSGKMSVIPKSQARPLQPRDMNIPTQYEGLALPLIINGNIQWLNLRWAKLDETWLKQQLQANGVTNVEDVALAQLDTSGRLYVDRFYQGGNETPQI